MPQTIATPIFEISKKASPTIEIDMWEIQGVYADGKWHQLIHGFVKEWVVENSFQNKATLWSVSFPSVNFFHPGHSFFLVTCGLPNKFLAQLEDFLSTKLSKQVRLSDEVIVARSDGWKPYLHLEQGKVWEYSDYNEWVEVE